MKNNNKQNQGQVAIIVLMVSAVLLSLGLSASKKAVIDTKIDTDEALLKEAFNVAESGINNYINTTGVDYNSGNGNNAVVSKEDIGGGDANILEAEGLVLTNNKQFFWLVDHQPDGSIGTNYYNGNITLAVDDNFTGALKIDYFYIEAGVYKVSRSGYNFHATNNTVEGYTTIATDKFVDINTGVNSPMLIVVTPIGSSTGLSISGPSIFPIQGEQLTAVGTANNGVKTQIKTRNVYEIPYFLLEAMTAGKNIQ